MYYSVVRGPNRIAIHGWSVGLVGRLPVAVPRATERACWVESQALACSVLSLYMSLSLLGGLSHCRMRCERCLCQSERRHVERASGEQRARMRCTRWECGTLHIELGNELLWIGAVWSCRAKLHCGVLVHHDLAQISSTMVLADGR
jgi:hypothetical protein